MLLKIAHLFRGLVRRLFRDLAHIFTDLVNECGECEYPIMDLIPMVSNPAT